MDIYPGRVITPDAVYHPIRAVADEHTGELHVDAKQGAWRKTITNATIALAPADIRAAYDTERMWTVTGEYLGEPVTWIVTFARGCGCGGTQELAPDDTQLALLASV